MNERDQSAITTDQNGPADALLAARSWLDRAASWLTNEERLRAIDDIKAAALIGTGYAHVASVEQWAAARVEDLQRHASERAEDLERIRVADEAARAAENVATEAHRAVAETARRQIEFLEQDPSAVAAVQRAARAVEEARPHDGERFLGFTNHGHPVGSKTVPDGVERPRLVSRCGGPGMCPECANDAARLGGDRG